MLTRHTLLLSGSHRKNKTTSTAILDYIEHKLASKNHTIYREKVSSLPGNSQSANQICDVLKQSDTFVIYFPLYFDTLPYPLIAFLEELQTHQELHGKRRIIFIVHCGLPEASHCQNALAICKEFAESMNFIYTASVAIPNTGAIDGASIEKTKRITGILDQLAGIISNQLITSESKAFIAKPSMSPILFRFFGNMIMNYFAGKNNVSVFQKGYDNK